MEDSEEEYTGEYAGGRGGSRYDYEGGSGAACTCSLRRIATTAAVLLVLAQLALLSQFLYHHYTEEYEMCVQQKKVALSITHSDLCVDAAVRDVARTYHNIDCMQAERQLRIHPRKCATDALYGHAFGWLSAHFLTGMRSGLARVWGNVTHWFALTVIYPVLALGFFMWLSNQRETTRRYTLDLQSRDRRERQQTDMMERTMLMLERHNANQQLLLGVGGREGSGYRRAHRGGPTIEEYQSAEEADEWADEGAGEEESDDVFASPRSIGDPGVGPPLRKRKGRRGSAGSRASSGRGSRIPNREELG